MESKKLMVIDGNSIVNRAYFGIRMLNAPDGTPTNAVYGFVAILQRLLELEAPDGLCVCFDVHAPTFRHRMYDGYKAQRRPMDDELRVQIPLLKEFLDAMGIRRLEMAGWEADDLLGTLAKRCEAAGWQCRLVTGDKDALQLITDGTHVDLIKTRMGATETTEYTPDRFREEYGMEPGRMVDLKALMGDSSDNIPGVAGIGEKTALALLQRFGTLDGVYENLDDASIKPAQRTKLTAGRDMAYFSYDLATIRPEAPIELAPEQTLWSLKPSGALYDICRRLGFFKLIEKWGLAPAEETAAAPEYPAIELSIGEAMERVQRAPLLAVLPADGLDTLALCDGINCFTLRSGAQGGLFAMEETADGYNALLRLVFSPETKKIGHNVKDVQRLCLDEGLSPEGFVFDTALAGYLLSATDSDYAPDKLAAKYLSGSHDGADALMALYPVLDEKLRENGMEKLYYDMELPLCGVLARMEREGFLVDRKALYDFGESLTGEIEQLEAQIWAEAGHKFNINSPKQLGEVLFGELGLPAGKKTKTGWSTNADVLDRLRADHPIVQRVLDYRELAKLKSTYADGLLKVIGPDGRIHTSFQMTVTATGRLSSTEPNLQNIPIRKPSGALIRRMFIAGPGQTLVDADYSQIELRLLAHMSGDERMIEGFRSGEDVHRLTAAQVFGVAPEDVTAQMRSHAKAVNFGIVYGISAFSLAQDIDVPQAEAKAYIETYLEKYSGVREYMERTIAEAKEKGFCQTLYGRRRALPELASSNFNLRSFGERVARNMPIQGTAADVMKLAMLRADRLLRERVPQARLLLQVHDELIAECPEALAEEVKAVLVEAMEGAAELSVPLTVDAKAARSWADAH